MIGWLASWYIVGIISTITIMIINDDHEDITLDNVIGVLLFSLFGYVVSFFALIMIIGKVLDASKNIVVFRRKK